MPAASSMSLWAGPPAVISLTARASCSVHSRQSSSSAQKPFLVVVYSRAPVPVNPATTHPQANASMMLSGTASNRHNDR